MSRLILAACRGHSEMLPSIAAGAPLGFDQRDVRLDGWALEARIYAEDPARGFLPSTGRLVRYQEPAGEGIGRWAPGQFTMVYAFGVGEVPVSISGGSGRRIHHTVRDVGAVTAVRWALRRDVAYCVSSCSRTS